MVKRPAVKDYVGVVITTLANIVIMQERPFLTNNPPGEFSNLPRIRSFSREIILPRFSPYTVSSGQELRLWYGEDLVAFSENDNRGRVCCDVFALYV